MDISSALGFALGWTNASTRSELQKQADRIIQAQAEEIRKLREPGGHPASVWHEPRTTRFVHADAPAAPGSGRGTLAAFFILIGIFLPPVGIAGLIFVFLREFLWLVAIGCVCVVIVEPLGPLEISIALWIAGTCLWCLLSDKFSASTIPARRKQKKGRQKNSLASRISFTLAVLLVPAYLYALIVWTVR